MLAGPRIAAPPRIACAAMSRLVARSLIPLLACASLALAACGSSDSQGGPSTQPSAADPVTLTGGTTTLALDPQTAGVLSDNAVTVRPVAPARTAPDAVAFPILSGKLDGTTLGGTIVHGGGLRFTSDAASVEIRDLRVSTLAQQVTGSAGHGRLPVFQLDQRRLSGSASNGALNGSGLVALLTPQAASALNTALRVSVFTPKLIVGDLSVAATTG